MDGVRGFDSKSANHFSKKHIFFTQWSGVLYYYVELALAWYCNLGGLLPWTKYGGFLDIAIFAFIAFLSLEDQREKAIINRKSNELEISISQLRTFKSFEPIF